MSIILKGIDMPSENDSIIVEIFPSGGCSTMKVEKGECYELCFNGEAEAIQIPKGHGRIIDEKEAIRGWCKGCAFNDGTCGKDETICEDKEMCKYAPTILEAEEEK